MLDIHQQYFTSTLFPCVGLNSLSECKTFYRDINLITNSLNQCAIIRFKNQSVHLINYSCQYDKYRPIKELREATFLFLDCIVLKASWEKYKLPH